MKVRIVKGFVTENRGCSPGMVVDFPDDTARRFIEAGLVEEDGKPLPLPFHSEKAVSPPENKMETPAKNKAKKKCKK